MRNLAVLVIGLFYFSISVAAQIPGKSSTTPENSVGRSTEYVQSDTRPSLNTLSTQKRMNRYFHEHVIGGLRTCWPVTQDRNSITILHEFVNDESGSWMLRTVAVSESTLDAEQSEEALKCMRESSKDTKLELAPDEVITPKMTLFWTWPVPLPNYTEQDFAELMAGSGGAGIGCDGNGAAKKCSVCKKASDGTNDFACVSVCVGYRFCSLNYQDGKRSGCSYSEHCASGGPFGLAGFDISY